MAVDTSERPINIKKLVIEEPEKADYSFNPCDEIDAACWTKMLERASYLESRLETDEPTATFDSTHDVRNYLYALVSLFPEKKNQLNLDDSLFDLLSPGGLHISNMDYLARLETNFKTIFGKGLGKEVAFDAEHYLNAFKTDDATNSLWLLSTLADFKIANPNIDLHLFKSEEIKKIVAGWAGRQWSVWETAEFAANCKIVYGEWDFLDLNNQKFWAWTKQFFKQGKINPDSDEFAQFCANIKILSAERLKFTDHGLELEMPNALDEKIPVLPEVKRYGN